MKVNLDPDDMIIIKKRELTKNGSLQGTFDHEYAMPVKDFIDSIGKILSKRGWISEPSND